MSSTTERQYDVFPIQTGVVHLVSGDESHTYIAPRGGAWRCDVGKASLTLRLLTADDEIVQGSGWAMIDDTLPVTRGQLLILDGPKASSPTREVILDEDEYEVAVSLGPDAKVVGIIVANPAIPF